MFLVRIKTFSILLFVLLLLSSPVLSQSYYADIDIVVDKEGFVDISGDTNIQGLLAQQSPNFTSKQGSVWLLNISTDILAQNSYYEINLPQGSSVTYMKIPFLSRIQTSDSGLTIIGYAQEKNLNFIVQYEINQTNKESTISPWWFMVLISFLLAIIIVLIRFRFKKSSTSNKDTTRNKNKNNFDLKKLSSRQQEIYILITKNNGSITQSALEKQTGLPKSSLSRNIDSLVRKDIVIKEQKGMSNLISLKKD